jgi:hypothetical protein
MATLEETLRSLGLSAARGIPQLATGFVDLAALPFTATGMLKPEQAVGSTAYLTSKGLLPPEQQGLLNQTTELLSGAMNPAVATKAALAKGGLLAAGVISPSVARQIPMKTNLPQSSEFISAVQNTPNAQITNEGLLMRVQRNQVPEQSGMESVRTGVFYLPEGSGNARYYSGTGAGKYYGGTEKITGETLLRNPLFIKGATGGKAPEVAYDAIKGKGAIKELDEDVSRILSLSFIKRNDPRTYFEAVEGFLSKYGGDPSMAENIVQNSQKGNQLKYALRENAIANTVRNAGHDAVLGYSKGKQGNFLSEVFDLREATYPTKEGGYTLNPMFQPK